MTLKRMGSSVHAAEYCGQTTDFLDSASAYLGNSAGATETCNPNDCPRNVLCQSLLVGISVCLCLCLSASLSRLLFIVHMRDRMDTRDQGYRL
ncbi:unnamed protein product [Protopolystoma xenopodis]|uniref:Uncharacterized protein n=1 Tax=Protopolystoma xenopodis TaxID=117903 RepID=A0A3S5AIY7_9PLAT|nr:unnamed protein product [Protopolystoma xenopodis]